VLGAASVPSQTLSFDPWKPVGKQAVGEKTNQPFLNSANLNRGRQLFTGEL